VCSEFLFLVKAAPWRGPLGRSCRSRQRSQRPALCSPRPSALPGAGADGKASGRCPLPGRHGQATIPPRAACEGGRLPRWDVLAGRAGRRDGPNAVTLRFGRAWDAPSRMTSPGLSPASRGPTQRTAHSRRRRPLDTRDRADARSNGMARAPPSEGVRKKRWSSGEVTCDLVAVQVPPLE
jgi:hypothetical protein